MIIEAGQVWRKNQRNGEVLVFIEEVAGDKIRVHVGDVSKIMNLVDVTDALDRNDYFLCTDLTKALL